MRVDWEKVSDFGAYTFAIACVGIICWATWLMFNHYI